MLDKAEPYISSAWELAQHGEVGLHLAKIYLKRGEKQRAISQLALSLKASRPPKEVRSLINELVGKQQIETMEANAAQELIRMRTLEVNPGVKEDADARFNVLISSNQPPEVSFLSGSENLRVYEEHLRKVQYPCPAPDNQPCKLMRQGELRCSKADGKCLFVFELPMKARGSELISFEKEMGKESR
jgi:hypothetical protein